MLEFLRGSVRPIVTYALAGAFIVGFFQGLISADAFLGMALFAIKSWFDSRQDKPIELTDVVK